MTLVSFDLLAILVGPRCMDLGWAQGECFDPECHSCMGLVVALATLFGPGDHDCKDCNGLVVAGVPVGLLGSGDHDCKDCTGLVVAVVLEEPSVPAYRSCMDCTDLVVTVVLVALLGSGDHDYKDCIGSGLDSVEVLAKLVVNAYRSCMDCTGLVVVLEEPSVLVCHSCSDCIGFCSAVVLEESSAPVSHNCICLYSVWELVEYPHGDADIDCTCAGSSLDLS